MAQVNKYADRAAYTADAKRLSTKSAVSFIENETTTIYDGVNTVVGKSAAAIGDLAVFDKTDGVIKYIKSATIAKAQIPANLVPLAVVYARQGEQLLIVSLDHVSAGAFVGALSPTRARLLLPHTFNSLICNLGITTAPDKTAISAFSSASTRSSRVQSECASVLITSS